LPALFVDNPVIESMYKLLRSNTNITFHHGSIMTCYQALERKNTIFVNYHTISVFARGITGISSALRVEE